MLPNQFDASVHGTSPVLTIRLRGGLTMAAEEILNQAYRSATDQAATTIVLDFSEVDFMNSSGIALIFGLLTNARAKGQQLLLAGVTPHYQKILSLVGLVRYAPIFATEADARRSVEPPT
jgi:anti-sigma B factor antagonist